MEIKIILLYGDKLINIISNHITIDFNINFSYIYEKIKNSDLLNNVEKEQYLIYIIEHISKLNERYEWDYTIKEIFINPIYENNILFDGPMCFYRNNGIVKCINRYICKRFNNDEDVISTFGNYIIYNQLWRSNEINIWSHTKYC